MAHLAGEKGGVQRHVRYPIGSRAGCSIVACCVGLPQNHRREKRIAPAALAAPSTGDHRRQYSAFCTAWVNAGVQSSITHLGAQRA
ncbi:hypothetical protein NYR97_08230 [Xanthomonas hydrangeae]|uniref:Uncharacterized protein n=1 Tax=Xanthomonas hydrangeae TaxID=2775159 RepID=A0AAU0BFG3_9XANT|nr:hypothetical protein [Xanthomonas hydrangeae]WOB51340.1 hypothetical protein NYR97_08230 [Xanthomonas hydrangeae]